MKDDPELRERWDMFHIVGDALRGDPLLSAGFHEAFAQRLAAEPTVLAPRRFSRQARKVTTYALSAAASVSAAAFVAWVAMMPSEPGGLVADNAPLAVPDASAMRPVSTDASMNEYFLAHQGFSPSTAIQGLAPYIRSVSATRPPEQRR
jgi:sigma-E factor negative regulatory protein RseA